MADIEQQFAVRGTSRHPEPIRPQQIDCRHVDPVGLNPERFEKVTFVVVLLRDFSAMFPAPVGIEAQQRQNGLRA